jgi:hypothetical protein
MEKYLIVCILLVLSLPYEGKPQRVPWEIPSNAVDSSQKAYFNARRSEYQQFLDNNADFQLLQAVPSSVTGAEPKDSDQPELRQKHEEIITMDPKLKRVPIERLEIARREVEKLLNREQFSLSASEWIERGPNNIGGRTRALMFDPNDPNKKKVWAGGVAGGLWYNNDITSSASSWQPVNDFWENLALSSLAYDPSNTQVMYAGTGEGYGNGDAIMGGGIWKTANGGTTWARLSSTIPTHNGSWTTLGGAFETVQDIVVHPNGTVFAGTRFGVVKSTDGGTNWSFAHQPGSGFANFVSDLEIGSDGVLYAAYGLWNGWNNGKLFKSADAGLTWTNITPPNASGQRTEIALAPSTSGANQMIYIAIHYGGSNEIGVFMKSTDAGTSWTSMTIPTYSDGKHFTGGQGWYDLILAVHPTDPNFLYVGGTNNTRSFDGGATWADVLVYWYTHPDQHAIVFRPGSPNEVVIGNDGGVFYSPVAGNTATTTSALNYTSRNLGYNVTQYYAIAQKNVTNDHYLLAGSQDNGTHKITSAPPAPGPGTQVTGGDGMLCFIDQDNPNVQISSYQYNSYNLLDANGNYTATLVPFGTEGYFLNPADYDSQNNILYTFRNSNYFTRVRNVGSTNNRDDLGLYIPGPSFIKVAKGPNTLFVGTYSGSVHKVTNTHLTSATPTLINYGIGMTGTISSIDVGANDDTLLVVLSNYGVQSVWYTSNGGTSWVNKDNATLPDMPIRYGIFNPLNTNQVMLATSLGVWATSNFLDTSPTWFPINTKLAHVSCDWLHYRSSDGQVAVGTHGRGMFITDAFSATIARTITITNTLPSSICKGRSFPVEIFSTGPFKTTNEFQIILSDSSGTFETGTRIIGSGTSTSLMATLPDIPDLVPGHNYRIQVQSIDPIVTSSQAGPLSILQGGLAYNESYPSVSTTNQEGFTVSASLNAPGNVYFVVVGNEAPMPSNEQIKNGKNADEKNSLQWGKLIIPTANATASMEVSGLLPGIEYDVFFFREGEGIISNCSDEAPLKRDVQTTGTALAYCTPTYTYHCSSGDVIADFELTGTNLSYINTGCTPNSYYGSTSTSLVQGQTYPFVFRTYYNNRANYYPQNIAIWIDLNKNGVFEVSERLFQNTSGTGYEISGNLTIPAGTLPGTTRLRIRCQYYADGLVNDPCEHYAFGETEDHLVTIEDNNVIVSAQTGDWDQGITWIGGIAPNGVQKVKIQPGHIIRINGINASAPAVNIVNGYLDIINNGTLLMNTP